MNWLNTTSAELELLVLLAYADGVSKEQTRRQIIDGILQMAGERWREASAYIPKTEFREDEVFFGCQTDDYGDVVDPITLEDVPFEKTITFTEGDQKWCFNIDSLFEYTEHGKFENPLTRVALPLEVVTRLQEHKQQRLVQITFTVEEWRKEFSFAFNTGFATVEAVVEIFRVLSAVGNRMNSSVDLLARHYVEDVTPGSASELRLEESIVSDRRYFVSKLNTAQVRDFAHIRALYFSVRKRYGLTSFLSSVQECYHNRLLHFAQGMTFMELTRDITGDGELVLLLPFPEETKGYTRRLKGRAPKKILPMPATEFLQLQVPKAVESEVTEFLLWCAERVANTSVDAPLLQKAFEIQFTLQQPPAFAQMARHLSFAQITDVYLRQPGSLLKAMVSEEFRQSEFYAKALGARTDNQTRAIQHFVRTGASGYFGPQTLADTFSLLPTLEYFLAIRGRVPPSSLYRAIALKQLRPVWELLTLDHQIRIYIIHGYNPREERFPLQEFLIELDFLIRATMHKFHKWVFFPFLEEREALQKYAASKVHAVAVSLFTALAEHLVESNVCDYFPMVRTLVENEHINYEAKVEILRKLVMKSRRQEIYEVLDIKYVVDIYNQTHSRLHPHFTDEQIRGLSEQNPTLFQKALRKRLISAFELYQLFLATKDTRLVEFLSAAYLELLDSELVFQTLLDQFQLQLPKRSFIYKEVRKSTALQRSFIQFCRRRDLVPQAYTVLSGLGLVQLTVDCTQRTETDRDDENPSLPAKEKQ